MIYVVACVAFALGWLANIGLRMFQFWRESRRWTLRGEFLTRTAKQLYNIEREPGEKDDALRARCRKVIESYSPQGSR